MYEIRERTETEVRRCKTTNGKGWNAEDGWQGEFIHKGKGQKDVYKDILPSAITQ